MASHVLYPQHISVKTDRGWAATPELAKKQYLAEAQTADTIANLAHHYHSNMTRSFHDAANNLRHAEQQQSLDEAEKYAKLGYHQMAQGHAELIKFHQTAGVDNKLKTKAERELAPTFQKDLHGLFDSGILAYVKPPITVARRDYRIGDKWLLKQLEPHRTEGSLWLANTSARFAENPYIKETIPEARRSMLTTYMVLARILGIDTSPEATASSRLALAQGKKAPEMANREREKEFDTATQAFEQGLKQISRALTPSLHEGKNIDEHFREIQAQQRAFQDGFIEQARLQAERDQLATQQHSEPQKPQPKALHDEEAEHDEYPDNQPERSILPTQHAELDGNPVEPPQYTFNSGPLQQWEALSINY